MKTILAGMGLAVALLLPVGVAAKPDQTEKRAAKAQCKAERGKGKATRAAFRAEYSGFRDCVRQNAAEEEAENGQARRNAARECRAERSEDPAAFRDEHGTNGGQKNAFGKCVSAKADEEKAEMDARDAKEIKERHKAARECLAERREMGTEAFREEHGTNHNQRNAFGKCVSSKTGESEPPAES